MSDLDGHQENASAEQSGAGALGHENSKLSDGIHEIEDPAAGLGRDHSQDGRDETTAEAAVSQPHPPIPDLNRERRKADDHRGEKMEVSGEDEHVGNSSKQAERIEFDASEHLARRAAEMQVSSEPSKAYASIHKPTSESDLPASPPPPVPPPKPTNEVGSANAELQFDEKRPTSDESGSEEPDVPQGVSETTGLEIQNIMDQFEDGMGGLGEQEIMSPRLERQQPVLVLPPRSSSLEAKDTFYLSPQTTGRSTSSQHNLDRASVTLSAPSAGLHQVAADDTESVTSTKAGSLFQPLPPTPEPEPTLPFDFHRFLEQLRHRTADPVARFLRSFLSEFGKKQWMAHEQVKIISDFLEFISKKMAQCEVWRMVSDVEFDNAREGMEKLVMNRLYSQTFSPAIAPPSGSSPRKNGKIGRSQADVASPHGPGRRGQHQEDVERDEVIAQKMRIYGWIQEEHLDIKPVGEKGRKFLGLAQQELLKINTYRAPRDKVICVLNCCKVIFGFLKNAKADQSADAFVPLLIYTVLRARPEHLVSNVQYIWRFRNQDKLGGEAGYYMSSLMGVVTFIENLDRTILTISDQEFERNVEQAVSAIAEKNKEQEYEEKAHATAAAAASARPMQHLSEKSALSRAEVTPRNSMDAERSSPRRNLSQRMSEKTQPSFLGSAHDDDEMDAVTGLLRTIQKPLSSIGRIFSDDNTTGQQEGLRPANTPQPSSTPRGLSPAPKLDRRPSAGPSTPQRQRSSQRTDFEDAAARQASAEIAEGQRVRIREHQVVVE